MLLAPSSTRTGNVLNQSLAVLLVSDGQGARYKQHGRSGHYLHRGYVRLVQLCA